MTHPSAKDILPAILTVDDRPANLIALRELLAPCDAEVLAASSGQEGLEVALVRSDLAVILLDVQMPEMDGFELAQLLRMNESTRTIPIIFVTAASADTDYQFRGYECGAVDFLRKPIASQVLLSKVQVFLDLSRQQSALRRAMEELEQANQAKSDFLANMSHEIRTPMTAILGFAESLLDPTLSESDRIDCVQTIRRNGENLMSIINDILDLAKVEAGKIRTDLVRCDPCVVVSEVLALIRIRAAAKGLALTCEFDGPIPESICTDPARLRQILINLIGNAIKFTETGSVILALRLVDEGRDPVMAFDVIDTGAGIPETETARLFQPFNQADTSASRQTGGTGLGLTISRRLAELLGGDIVIVRSQPGVGSIFRATVSTGSLSGVSMRQNPQTASVSDARPLAESGRDLVLQGKQILLAEDGPDNQRLISSVLRRAGAEVVVAENGQVALEAALAGTFDCILMDMQMPVLDGYEATTQLRAANYSGSIVALTAHAMSGDRERCLGVGCDDYETKPIDRKRLIATILSHVVAEGDSEEDREGALA